MPIFELKSRQTEAAGAGPAAAAEPKGGIFGLSVAQIVVAACAGLAAAGGIRLYNWHVRAARARASEVFYSARSVADLETVVGRYGSSPVAPLALLKLAKWHYNAGNYEIALQKYSEFKRKYPRHPLVEIAEAGRAHSLEAAGFVSEAQSAFAAFASNHADHALAPGAILGQIRCLASLGQHEEARMLRGAAGGPFQTGRQMAPAV